MERPTLHSLEQIDEAVALMAEAHIGWVRMDFLWADLEPTPGRFLFKRYDQILERLSDRGIRVSRRAALQLHYGGRLFGTRRQSR